MSDAGRRVVVTGGSGFIGSAVRAAFARRGDSVVGLDLRPREDSAGAVLAADLTSSGPWFETLRGADVMVHAAARVSEQGGANLFRRSNVDTTRQVLAAASAAGVGRVVHLSSITVVGPRVPARFDETQPVCPTGNPYTDTKIASEHLALAAAADGLPVTVLRPGDVYGPGSPQWTVRPVELIRRRLMVLPDGGHGLLDPVYVDDVVAAVLTAADASPRDSLRVAAAGGIYFVTGGRSVEAREFFANYAVALGRPLPSVSSRVLRAAAPFERAATRLGVELPFTVRTLEYVSRTGEASIERARDELGWSPRVDLAEGMRRTLEWLRLSG